jgi:hypothetical protein
MPSEQAKARYSFPPEEIAASNPPGNWQNKPQLTANNDYGPEMVA